MSITTEELEKDSNYLRKTLEKTRQKLLDQSKRNRLLNYKEKARDIAVIDEMANLVFEDLVVKEKKFYFDFFEKKENEEVELDLFEEKEPDRTLPASIISEEDVEERYRDNKLQTPYSERDLERRLRLIYRDHKSSIEETGANSLFLAIGFVEWSDTVEDPIFIRSPLMLVPVHLTREGSAGQAKYALSFDDEVLDSNYSLIEKLRNNFDINLPHINEDEKPEDYWARVESSIARRQEEGWNVVREMSMGVFRFTRQVMWHDLDPSRWPEYAPLVDKKVLKRILIGPKEGEPAPGQMYNEYPQDGDVNDTSATHLKLVRDADSSQYSALIDSINCDGGLVIEGPPGTGKSQTITNLIAVAMEKGLSVLFVAEKMAALDVVYKRLAGNGLDQFCLQLHGLKTSKKELLYSIAQRMGFRPTSPDELNLKEKQLAQARSELVMYSTALSEHVGPEEIPLYDLTWRIECLRQDLPEDIESLELEIDKDVSLESYTTIKNLLNDLGKEWSAIPKDARDAWSGYLPLEYKEHNSDYLLEANSTLVKSLEEIEQYLYDTGAQNTTEVLFEVERLLEISTNTPGDSIKETPAGMDLSIIYRIAMQDALIQYRELLKEMKNYSDGVNRISSTFDYSATEVGKYVRTINTHTNSLAGIVVDSGVTVSQLSTEITEFEHVIQYLNDLAIDSIYLLEMHNKVARTIDDYDGVSNDAAKYLSAPVELCLHATPMHAKSAIKNYLERAKNQYSELNDRACNLQEFVVSRVKSSEAIDEARICIEQNVDNIFSFFNGDYRKAKKKIKGLLKTTSEFKKTEEFVGRLNILVELCRDREAYKNSADLNASLGSLFLGMETNWERIEELISYSQELRNTIGPESTVIILSDWDAHIDKVSEIKDKIDRSLSEIHLFKDKHPFPDNLWTRPVKEISGSLSPWIPKLVSADNELNQSWLQTTSTFEYLREIIELYEHIKIKEKSIESMDGYKSILNSSWDRGKMDFAKLETIEVWISGFLSIHGMHISILHWLFNSNGTIDRDKLDSLVVKTKNIQKSWSENITVLTAYGDLEYSAWQGGKFAKVDEFIEKLKQGNSTIVSLSQMMRWAHTRESVTNKGFGQISDYVAKGVLVDDQCGKAYDYLLHKSIYSNAINDNPELVGFSQTRYENLRSRFAQMDMDIMQINASQIATKLAQSHIPSGTGSGPVSSYTQKRLIEHEVHKKSRHIPIRQLIKRSADALKALKPCFLMSPLSVAQYLGPGDIHFDLVVMDEASQLRPEDALGAIARADKAIIVGDPKQLPPTSFFDATSSSEIESEEDMDILDDTEAILDVCLK